MNSFNLPWIPDNHTLSLFERWKVNLCAFNLIVLSPYLRPCTRVSNLLVEHASVEGDCSTRSQTVGEWLDSIKMGRYTELFMEGGYSSLETVAQMTSE